jgi:two-component system response regulator GlrR
MAAPQSPTVPIVVVVDDEPAVLVLMERVLAAAGYQVRTASDGLSAIGVLSELPAPPTVVVSDLRMEPVDGASLARIIDSRWPGTRVLLVSGWGPEAANGALRWPLLNKPFSPDQLLETVARMLPPLDPRIQAS